MQGWNEDLMVINDAEQLPAALLTYIDYIEQATGLPITIVSVGRDRKQTLIRKVVA